MKGLFLVILLPLSEGKDISRNRQGYIKTTSKKKYRGVANRIDRCAMKIFRLSSRTKAYPSKSNYIMKIVVFENRNYSLSKLFPSNVQKISKLLCLENIFGPKFLNGWNGIFEGSENCQNRHNCYKTWFLPSNWQNKVRSTKCALSTSITVIL